jgi:protein-tyrosine phosphatase
VFINHTMMNFITKKGCLYLVGEEIDEIANKWISNYTINNPTDNLFFFNNHAEKDFHITVFHSKEFKSLKTKNIIPETVPLVFDMGVGFIFNEDSKSIYVVIYSPKLQKLRKDYGFDVKDFHITLGFLNKDIHNKPKSLKTLCYQNNTDLILKNILTSSVKINKDMTEFLLEHEYIEGLYHSVKQLSINSSIEKLYNYVEFQVISSNFKVSDEKYISKIIEILNMNIIKRINKFSLFWYYVIQKNHYSFRSYRLPRNFSFVSDNLCGAAILSKSEYFKAFKGLGVTDIITLLDSNITKNNECDLSEKIKKKSKDNGINYYYFDVVDRTPPTTEQMESIVDIIKYSKLTVVHCFGGVGRTATAIAAYLIKYKDGPKGLPMSISEAKKILETRKTILSNSQIEFLKSWYKKCQNEKYNPEIPSLPPIMMMIGYPSSGKSSFSSILSDYSEKIYRINQDEQGRKECESQAGSLVKKGTVILDRCNLTKKERKEWLDLMHNKKSWAIFFNVTPEECKWRIVRRQNHPTIKKGSGTRILETLKGSLELPVKEEGFSKIIRINGFEDCNHLLRSWGLPVPESTIKDDHIIKFPRTRHVQNYGSATRDDLIMSLKEVSEFLDKEIFVEEKIDGANMGFSIKDNKIVAQNRSHYVNSTYHAQFKYLDKWIFEHSVDLWEILQDPNGFTGSRILYGEWVYAKHSIPYTDLPDYFIAFDLYDRIEEKFWSRPRLEKTLSETSINLIKLIDHKIFQKPEEFKDLVNNKSKFYNGPIEGLYLRICNDDWLIKRGKIVRPGFTNGIEGHWSKAELTPNTKISY